MQVGPGFGVLAPLDQLNKLDDSSDVLGARLITEIRGRNAVSMHTAFEMGSRGMPVINL